MKYCRILGLLLLPLVFVSCGEFVHGQNSKALGQIKYDYVYSMEVFERHMTISPAGDVDIAQRTGTTDKDVRFAKGTLTREQKADIIAAFRDWNQLKESYPVFFRGPIIDITYNGHKVESAGGETAPDDFNKAQATLKGIADSILTATTQPMTTKP